MSKGLNVHSEIGKLKKVVLHRPGRDLVNVKAEEFEDVWIHDCFYLDVAQKEHDAFADLLRSEGVEVLYMEKLVAEALDACPSARAEFTDTFMAESGIVNPLLEQAVREKLDAISDSYQFVLEAMSVNVKHITALDMPGILMVVPNRSPYIIGMVFENRFIEGHFTISLFPIHMVKQNAFAHGSKRIAREIRARKRLQHQIIGLNINAHTLAIGISQRTEAAAIEELEKNLFWGSGNSEIDTVYAIKIPNGYAYMHLDTVCTMVDFDKFTVYPGIFETLRVYRLTRGDSEGMVAVQEIDDTLEHILEMATGVEKVQLIECGAGDMVEASREQWNDGSNTLAVAPGKVCVYERNVVTNDELYKNGLELLVVPSEELSRGRGGPRCMSMPFWREDI